MKVRESQMSNPLLRAFTELTGGSRRTVESVTPARAFNDVILPPATRRALDQATRPRHESRSDLQPVGPG